MMQDKKNSKTLAEYRLIDILISLESGARPKGGVNGVIDEIPYLGGEHINNDGTIKFQNLKFISRAFFNSMNRGKIQKNDVLVVKDGATTGKVTLVDENFPYIDAAVNEHIFICRPNPEMVLPKFLFFHIFSLKGQNQIDKSFHGSAQGGITLSFANEYKILLPPLPVQRQIVAVLEQAEAVKWQRQEADALTEALLQSMFLEMFGDPARNKREWPIKTLKELCFSITDGKHGDCTDLENSGYYFISAKDIINGKIDYSDSRQITKEDYLETNKRLKFEIGDIILTNSGSIASIGKTAIAEDIERTPRTTFQKSVAIIKSNKKIR